MNVLQAAIEADRSGETREGILLSIELYERSLNDEASLDAAINLAVLYWHVSQYGFWVHLNLPIDVVNRAWSRMEQIFELASRCFSGAAEIEFWRPYIFWIALGDDFDPRDCREIMRARPDYLEPAMYLFSATRGDEGRAQVQRLLVQAKKDGTCRARYVASVCESALHQNDWSGEN